MTHKPDIPRRRSTRLPGFDYSQAGAYFVTIVTQGRLCLFGDVVDETVRLNDAGWMAHRVWESLPQRFSSVEVDYFVVMPNHVHGVIFLNRPLLRAGERATTRVAPTGQSRTPNNRTDATTAENEPSVGASLVGARSPAPNRRADATTAENEPSVGASLVGARSPAPNRRADATTAENRATTRVAPTGRSHVSIPRLGDVVGAYKSLATVEYARGVRAGRWQPFFKRLWQRNYYERIIRDQNELDRAREYIVNNPLKWALDRENPANQAMPKDRRLPP